MNIRNRECNSTDPASSHTVSAEIIETRLIGAAPTQLFLTLYKLTKNAPPLV